MQFEDGEKTAMLFEQARAEAHGLLGSFVKFLPSGREKVYCAYPSKA